MRIYFKDYEKQCSCCGEFIENPTLLEMLNTARKLAGIPFIITSWYRCLEHNRKIGSSDTSSHPEGKAVDIAFKDNNEAFIIVKALMDAGFVRIGINYKKKFIHADIDMDKSQKTFFPY